MLYDNASENLRKTLGKLNKNEKENSLVGNGCDIIDNQNANAKKLKLVCSEYQLEQLMISCTRVAVATIEHGVKRITH